jgi:hypothetical protein
MTDLEAAPTKGSRKIISRGAWIGCALVSFVLAFSSSARSGAFHYGPGVYIPELVGGMMIGMIFLLSVVGTATLLFRWIYGLFKKR